MKHGHEIARFLRSGDVELTKDGLLIHSAIVARGRYFHSLNGKDLQIDPNLIPAQGILHILDTALGAATQITDYFLAPYSGNATPASNWTAANFNANATEFINYDEAARQEWISAAGAAGKIGNLASRAIFTIAAAQVSIPLYGAGMLSASGKASTAGVLVSATRFASARTVVGLDVFELGYEVELTDS